VLGQGTGVARRTFRGQQVGTVRRRRGRTGACSDPARSCRPCSSCPLASCWLRLRRPRHRPPSARSWGSFETTRSTSPRTSPSKGWTRLPCGTHSPAPTSTSTSRRCRARSPAPSPRRLSSSRASARRFVTATPQCWSSTIAASTTPTRATPSRAVAWTRERLRSRAFRGVTSTPRGSRPSSGRCRTRSTSSWAGVAGPAMRPAPPRACSRWSWSARWESGRTP
jgi:hypothetical protein